MAAKTFKAKPTTVPKEVYAIYDSFTDRNGNNFTGSLALDGNLRKKEKAAIAMGFAQSMLVMMKIEHDIAKNGGPNDEVLLDEGEKFSHGRIMEVLLTGMGLSYLLGNMKWSIPDEEGKLPALIPSIEIAPHDYEFIQFRGGGKAPSDDVMGHLMQHIENEGIGDLFKDFMRYNPITKEYSYKSKSGFVHLLVAIFDMIDSHICDAKHYKD